MRISRRLFPATAARVSSTQPEKSRKMETTSDTQDLESDKGETSQETQEETTFKALGLVDVLCEACEQLKWKCPTKIQRESIPIALEGVVSLALDLCNISYLSK